ncbi:MAG: alpha/beta fold hydrolase [Solirubrobacteraceae bacterium]|nr:alpha/beta fold hydrolase [Solirubrobacteraceae bacterium]
MSAHPDRLPLAGTANPTRCDTTIAAADGRSLGASIFRPRDGADPEQAVVVNSATGVPRRFYDGYASYLRDHGIGVVLYDYRGIGDSRFGSVRACDATMEDWGRLDYPAALAAATAAFPKARCSVVGHSAGGWLAGLPHDDGVVNSVITVGTQSGHWRWWSGADRVKMAALWFGVMPAVTAALGYYPAKRLGAGEDLPAGVARQWAYWGRHADYLVDERGTPMRDGFSSLAVPVRSYSFTDDRYAPRAAVDDIHALFVQADVERIHLSPEEAGAEQIGHFGFFRAEHQHTLWADALRFLLGPGVSGHPA